MTQPSRHAAVRVVGEVLLAVSLVMSLAMSAGSCGRSSPDATPVEDLFLPDGAGPVPLVVLVPGGGWETADPRGLAGLAAALAESGVAAAPARIRAAGDGVTYPTPVEDVLCAVAGAAAGLRERGRAASTVTVLGHSSGAHLAALATLAFDDYSPRCDAPVVRPDALVGMSGPYDISRVPGVAMALLGSSPDDDPEAWASANAVQRAGLRPGVPVLLLHGRADEIVPVDFTEDFGDALEAGGHPTVVEIVPGADHASIYAADVSADRVVAWLEGLR